MPDSIILAYSGGLDTSFCIPYLAETHRLPVHAVSVDCTGLAPEAAGALRDKAMAYGAASFRLVDGTRPMYDRILSWLIRGNVLRDRTYPLCVGAERFIQAEKVADVARELGARRVAHGSTGAGNDQVRFDVALRTLLPGVEILTPIRDQALTRSQTTAYLRERGFEVSDKTTQYSINDGLWGTTIGGKETTTSGQALPFEAFPHLGDPATFTHPAETVSITFEKGLPTALNGKAMDPIPLLLGLRDIGRRHGVGRGMHLGDTILGIKGRIGFEAPVPTLVYAAHKELEKLTLTKWQRHIKDQLADTYGMLLHEGHFYDPVMRDIEAYLQASQEWVDGEVRLHVGQGQVFPLGADSPNSLMNSSIAKYGEESSGWTGEEARAFSKLIGMATQIAHQVQTS
jgi:argininosuccinate synthase